MISLLNYKDGVLDPSCIVHVIDGGTEVFGENARVVLPGMSACTECVHWNVCHHRLIFPCAPLHVCPGHQSTVLHL